MVALAIAALPTNLHGRERPDREIVVLGEVQGAANTVAAFLEHLDLIDSEHHWIGGDTILIQTGDLIDDGEHVRAALDLFMRLQDEAAAAGGRVIVLMGKPTPTPRADEVGFGRNGQLGAPSRLQPSVRHSMPTAKPRRSGTRPTLRDGSSTSSR
jgi:hypothetical protein